MEYKICEYYELFTILILLSSSLKEVYIVRLCFNINIFKAFLLKKKKHALSRLTRESLNILLHWDGNR